MFFGKRKEKPIRQDWRPHWILRILHGVWLVALSLVKIAVGAVATVFCIGAVCAVVFVGLLGNYLQEDIIPEAEGFSLENYNLDQTSFVYYVDNNGDIQQLQRIFTSTDRQWAEFEDIPKDLINAAIAIEDHRFYEHQGVDWITTVKACGNMFFGGSGTFGGSTITQQLIKNLTEEDSVTVQRKVLEIFRAQLFERRYDKEVIMEWYLNTIYLGQGCYGVKSAAATYFGKELEMLTTAECASLISITNNPSLYDPYNVDEEVGLDGKANNRKRQVNTLWRMSELGLITEKEYKRAMVQTMVFKNGIADGDRLMACTNDGCGYETLKKQFRQDEDGNFYCPSCEQLTNPESDASKSVYSFFVDTVLEDVAKAMAKANYTKEWNDDVKKIYMNIIQRGGFHIYTTLDMDIQNQIDAIYSNLEELPDARSGQQLQSAMVFIDNATGDIVGMAGGVGEKKDHDAFNRATDSTLQTGSSMKALTVYGPAFEMGAISPATVIKDLPMHYDLGTAFPRNDNYKYNYSRTVFSGVVSSVNTIAVNVLDLIGVGYAYNFAKDQFGLSTLTNNYVGYDGMIKSDEDYSPLAMGALTRGCTIRDMAAAFATYANDGVYREARTFTKVYDSEGNLVLDNDQESRQILSEKTVNYMTYCLQNAVRGGTGYDAYMSNIDVAGKTGTSDSFKDRWFCGYTGYYTAAVWVGYDIPERIYMTNFGGNPAAMMWKKVMQPLHEGKENVTLWDSSEMTSVTVCLDSGKIATDACKQDVRTGLARTENVRVYRDDIPEGYCDKHVMVDYCKTGDGAANEYCMMFALAEQNEVVEKALVKMTAEEIEELLKAEQYGLEKVYLDDGYVYYVDAVGNPINFKGMKGDANVGVNAPCIVCTVHTKAAWDSYVASHFGDSGFPGLDAGE